MKELVDAEDNGQVRYSTYRKAPVQITPQGIWFDLSMSPGHPVPQYYAASPLVAIALSQSTDGGIFHAGAVSPKTKHLRQIMLQCGVTPTPLPMPMMLLDYLLFYPFIKEGTTGPQTMTNTVTIPRYTDGAGVQIMAVSVAGRTGGQSFTVSYTNSSGVAGRTTVAATQNSVSINGNIVTSDKGIAGSYGGPFLPLQTGDTGVRSIESVTMNGADVGLFTLVLVKPLAQMQIRGIDAPVEVDYMQDFLQAPIIKDDAYLNFICLPNGSITGVSIMGDAKFVWN